jgi:probable HAF family extracellular repeat protein
MQAKILADWAIGLMACISTSAALAQEPANSSGVAHYYVTRLGSLGGSSSSGNAITDFGSPLGNSNLAGDTETHAAIWIGARPFDLGTLGGPNSAVDWPVHNRQGVIAGFAETGAMMQENWSCSAFFPTTDQHVCLGFVIRDGEMKALPTLGGTNGYASGVNELGDVVGWAETTLRDSTCTAPQVFQFEAVKYGRDDRPQVLAPLSGDQDSAATALNDAGDVVGISGECNNAVGALSARHAIIWHNGKPSELPTFGGSGWNTPTDINERGDVVGFANMPPDIAADGSLEFNPVAFIWTKEKGTQKILPLEGDTNSIAYAINNRGQVVGQSFGGPEGARAFVWENGKATDLNAIAAGDAGIYLIYAEGINGRGEITGQACTFVDNACVFPASPSSPTPTFLAVPRYGTYAGSGVHASVPRELVRRSLRRWGDRETSSSSSNPGRYP